MATEYIVTGYLPQGAAIEMITYHAPSLKAALEYAAGFETNPGTSVEIEVNRV